MSTIPAAPPSASAARWRTGTLVYSTGGLVVLFGWLLLGDFAWWLRERSVVPLGQIMLKQFQASDLMMSLLAISFPYAVVMVVGPWISIRSDRHRGPRGRRIPYLFFPTPFIVLSLLGLAVTPDLGGWLHASLGVNSPGLRPCQLGVFAGFWALYELSTSVAGAVFNGLINDVVPQPVIGRFFGLFRMVSLIDGIIFSYFVIGHAETHSFWIFCGLAAVYGVCFTVMCFMVKEGEYPPAPPEPAKVPGAPRFATLRTYMRECFTHPYYLWIFIGTTLCLVSAQLVNAFNVFFAKSVGMSMASYGRHLAVTYTVAIGLAWFIGSLADKFHPLRLGLAALVGYIALMAWGGWAARDEGTFGIVLVAYGVLNSTYLTATASLGQRLYPQLKFAQFASAAAFLHAFCSIFVPPAMGAFLDATGHTYRHTLWVSCGLSLAGLACLLVVNRKFMALGGPKNYVAP